MKQHKNASTKHIHLTTYRYNIALRSIFGVRKRNYAISLCILCICLFVLACPFIVLLQFGLLADVLPTSTIVYPSLARFAAKRVVIFFSRHMPPTPNDALNTWRFECISAWSVFRTGKYVKMHASFECATMDTSRPQWMPYWWHSTGLLVSYLHSRVCYIILRARFIDFLLRFRYTVPQNSSLALRFAPFLLNLHVCTEIYCCLHSLALALGFLPFAWETSALRSLLCSQIFRVTNNPVEIYQPIGGLLERGNYPCHLAGVYWLLGASRTGRYS